MSYTLFVRIEILPVARQHSLLDEELRAAIEYPLFRYAITTRYPDANTYMFVARIENQACIEVAAEDEDGIEWAVFHGMMLTAARAREVHEHSHGTIDLRNDVPIQRPFIGPQTEPVTREDH